MSCHVKMRLQANAEVISKGIKIKLNNSKNNIIEKVSMQYYEQNK